MFNQSTITIFAPSSSKVARATGWNSQKAALVRNAAVEFRFFATAEFTAEYHPESDSITITLD